MGHTTMIYEAPMIIALKLFAHDWLSEVRTACETMAAQDKPVATTVIRIVNAYKASESVLSKRGEGI